MDNTNASIDAFKPRPLLDHGQKKKRKFKEFSWLGENVC